MRRLTAAAATAALLLLVACSPDAADFEAEAEKYIETRDFSEDAGLLRYTDVECVEPESTAADTLFTCAATADDGSRWQFDVEITGESSLKVITPPTLLAEASPDSSAPEDSSPTTTRPAPTTTSGATTTSAAGAATTARPTTTAAAAAATTTE